MINHDKVLGMIGMAKKAGKVVSGDELCDKAIKNGSAELIIIAKDASDLTKKSVKDACTFYQVNYIEYADKFSLGKFVGRDLRAVVSVNDYNFAQAIMKKYNSLN